MSEGSPQRRLILYMSVSLDGFAARRDGAMPWMGNPRRFDDHRQRGVLELLGQTGLLVLGRRAYDEMVQAWPNSTSPTGGLMSTVPHRADDTPNWPLVTYVDDIAEAMQRSKAAAGDRNVLVHGAQTAQRALAAGVLDELEIHQIPVLLGEGRRLFEGLGPEPIDLELVRAIGAPDVTHLHYRVRR